MDYSDGTYPSGGLIQFNPYRENEICAQLTSRLSAVSTKVPLCHNVLTYGNSGGYNWVRTGSQTECLPGCGNYGFKTQTPTCAEFNSEGVLINYVDDAFCSSISAASLYDSFDDTGTEAYHYQCSRTETSYGDYCSASASATCGDGILSFSEYCET